MADLSPKEARLRFEERHRSNYGAAADLTIQGDGKYEDRLAEYEWQEWQVAYAAGEDSRFQAGEDSMKERAAQVADSFLEHPSDGFNGKVWWRVQQKIAAAIRALASEGKG